jgi:hydrogenase maturation protease
MMTKEVTATEPLLIIGIGTEHAGDDAAGIAVARSLHSIELPGFARVIEFSGDIGLLMNTWDGTAHVILIDCISTQTSCGAIVAIDLHHGSYPSQWQTSLHAVNFAKAIELARVIGRLPASLMLYAIQGEPHENRQALSPEVRVAVEKVAAMIELDLLDALDRS